MAEKIPKGFQRSLMEQWLCYFVGGVDCTPEEWKREVASTCSPENRLWTEKSTQAFIEVHGERKLMQIGKDTRAIIVTIAETIVKQT